MEQQSSSDTKTSLKQLRDYNAKIGIVLGSGLNSLISAESAADNIPYSRFAEVPRSSVPGHVSQFVLSKVAKTPVIFAQGRVHLYEGRSAREVTAIVRLLAKAGVKTLIL